MKFGTINLQLFAEDESANTQEVAEPVATEEVTTQDTPQAEQEVSEDVFVDDDVSKTEPAETPSEKTQEVAEPEKPVQSDEDNKIAAAARRKVEAELQAARNQQDQLAKELGYNNFDEVLEAQARQKYEDQGYDSEQAERMMRLDKVETEMRQRENQARVQTEKAELRNQKYFAQLEPEIDTYLGQIPDANVKAIFNMIKGEKMDELITQETKAAKQRALNNMNNKDHIKADGKGAEIDSTFVDEEEFQIARKFDRGLTKEAYAKWKKQNQ